MTTYALRLPKATPTLRNEVAALAGKDRSAPVLMRADGTLPLQEFVAAVDTVKKEGFTRVNLEVQRP